MNCVLHLVYRERRPVRFGIVVAGDAVVSGMSLCNGCALGVVRQLVDGASIRDILRDASEGNLP